MIKFSFSNLFYNNKFVIFFSILISIISWIFISTSNIESYQKTLSDIPITITLSDTAQNDKLKLFSGYDIKADVTVSGNRIIMGMLSKNDIKIVAKHATDIVNSPGTYTLELTAKKSSDLSDYSFVGNVSPQFVTVIVDREKEISLKIEDKITYTADPTYFSGVTTFSTPTVTISGPESKINKISRIVAEKNINEVLNSTFTDTVPLNIYDFSGNLITTDLLNISTTDIDIVIPILYKKTVNITATVTDIPTNMKISDIAVLDPATLEIAGPENIVKNLTEVPLEAIKMSEINSDHKEFTKTINLPDNCKSLNNVYSATFKIKINNLSEKEFSISNIELTNLPNGRKASSYTKSLNVQAVGSIYNLRYLSANDFVATADLSNCTDNVGDKEIPITIRIKKNVNCWVYGDYTINVKIE